MPKNKPRLAANRTTLFRVGKHIVCIDAIAPTQTMLAGALPLDPGERIRRKPHPQKETTLKNKSKMFSMRMSELDYQAIRHKAQQAKMTLTDFITTAALDKPIVVIDGLDKVSAELKGIGRNLNQLTTLCNMGKIQCLKLSAVKKDFGAVFDYLYDLMDRR